MLIAIRSSGVSAVVIVLVVAQALAWCRSLSLDLPDEPLRCMKRSNRNFGERQASLFANAPIEI
jgi:hypothetical protein